VTKRRLRNGRSFLNMRRIILSVSHRRDAEDAEFNNPLLFAERAKSNQANPLAAERFFSNSALTDLTMLSHVNNITSPIGPNGSEAFPLPSSQRQWEEYHLCVLRVSAVSLEVYPFW